jgi:hypothetical protein
LYTANWTIPGGISFASKIDIISGAEGSKDVVVDDFNTAAELPGNCAPFRDPAKCESVMPVPTPIPTADPGTTAMSTTMLTLATVEATPTQTTSADTSSPPEPVHHDLAGSTKQELGLGEAFTSFFSYLTNYVVNFFFG